MKLSELTQSAIAEVGNICVGGGSNKISLFSDKIINISLVSFDIVTAEELEALITQQEDAFLTEATFAGNTSGKFLFSIPKDNIPQLLFKFPKMESFQETKDDKECLAELLNSFSLGFAEGLKSFTGLKLTPEQGYKSIKDVTLRNLPKKILCYKSVISVGESQGDFDICFFSDARYVVSRLVEALDL